MVPWGYTKIPPSMDVSLMNEIIASQVEIVFQNKREGMVLGILCAIFAKSRRKRTLQEVHASNDNLWLRLYCHFSMCDIVFVCVCVCLYVWL